MNTQTVIAKEDYKDNVVDSTLCNNKRRRQYGYMRSIEITVKTLRAKLKTSARSKAGKRVNIIGLKKRTLCKQIKCEYCLHCVNINIWVDLDDLQKALKHYDNDDTVKLNVTFDYRGEFRFDKSNVTLQGEQGKDNIHVVNSNIKPYRITDRSHKILVLEYEIEIHRNKRGGDRAIEVMEAWRAATTETAPAAQERIEAAAAPAAKVKAAAPTKRKARRIAQDRSESPKIQRQGVDKQKQANVESGRPKTVLKKQAREIIRQVATVPWSCESKARALGILT